jgi:hypothetical protein
MANIFEKRLLSPVGRRTATGAVLDIRLPWYRALPLSTVEVASLRIDGREVSAERMRFELNGRTYRLAEMGEQVKEYWFVTDSAFLHVDDAALLGDGHTVELTLNLYPPYIPHLTWVTRSQQTLRAA